MASLENNATPGVYFAPPGSDPNSVSLNIESPAKNRVRNTPLAYTSGVAKSRRWPKLFERSSGSWWNPKFNSEILEDQVQISSFPQTRRRFRYALFYIIACCVAWTIFFSLMAQEQWIAFIIGTLSLLTMTVLILVFTYTKFYERFYLPVSIFLSVLLCGLTLAQFSLAPDSLAPPNMSSVGTFAGSIAILLLMYTVIPMPLFVCVLIGVVFSIMYEVLTVVLTHMYEECFIFIVGKIFLHLCIHLIGIYIFIMSQVRKRSTFWKVGQSIIARRDLQVEKQIKEKMIHSLMPPQVAKEVMRSKEEEGSQGTRGKIAFRPFNMHQMENVSILFADIVGFTKMSSNKTAEHLVDLLNDLFGRFDLLCAQSGCEKISTLGDCYYCVSGCPEARPDHARCCINMGLGMIKCIKEFDEDNNEDVNMRVGVHTGKVLCGIVGRRRFKFDVFSNDVTLANQMESTGKPGQVHISEVTYGFVKDFYEVEEGEDAEDTRITRGLEENYDLDSQRFIVQHVETGGKIKTYFIAKHKTQSFNLETADGEDEEKENNNKDANQQSANSPKLNTNSYKDCSPRNRIYPESHSTEQLCEKFSLDITHIPESNGVGAAALLRQRQSGFFAASDMELDNDGDDSTAAAAAASCGSGVPEDISMIPINHTMSKLHLREETDRQLITCIQEDIDSSNQDYFYKPPINNCTLKFLDTDIESKFQNHYLDGQSHHVLTFSTQHVNAFLDMTVSFIFLALVAVCCFIMYGVQIPWIIFLVIALVIEISMIVPLAVDTFRENKQDPWQGKFREIASSWYVRHIIGAVIICFPAAAVYSNFTCDIFNGRISTGDHFYCYMILISLLHYCNFTMLSSWLKSTFATLAGIALLILIWVGTCPQESNNTSLGNETNPTNDPMSLSSEKQMFQIELIFDMCLLLLLVWFLNREFECSYRLSYHGDMEAAKDRREMQEAKEQADWLLHNIIPLHISQQLKKTSKYSKNHKDVGVIFACISNFDQFYDESFAGGIEYLRVLNELIADYEDLFDLKKYKDVEKIKTIGSTFMGASGLNEQLREQNRNPNSHLYALMDFCVDLQNVIDRFNDSIFNFNFDLKIGYNFGEVTSGVIGTTKLHYDIWGDTVNISSRMYSTGETGRVQVTADTAKHLGDKFMFEFRGKIPVKGKGMMDAYLLRKKQDGATWD